MQKTRPPYPEEFRVNAIKLLRSSGKSQSVVAKDLGVSANSLREWAKRADLDAGRRSDGLTTDEREELGRLRRANKVLTEEREILVKAAPGSTRQRNAEEMRALKVIHPAAAVGGGAGEGGVWMSAPRAAAGASGPRACL